MRISDWSSDVCSSDLVRHAASVRSEPGSNSQVDHAHRPSSSRRTPTGTLGASRSSLHVVLTCQQDTQARTTLSLDNDAARAPLPFYQLFQQQSHSRAAGLSSSRPINLSIRGALGKWRLPVRTVRTPFGAAP